MTPDPTWSEPCDTAPDRPRARTTIPAEDLDLYGPGVPGHRIRTADEVPVGEYL